LPICRKWKRGKADGCWSQTKMFKRTHGSLL